MGQNHDHHHHAGLDAHAAVIGLLTPPRQTAPVVFSSPHSGRRYGPDFVASSRLDAVTFIWTKAASGAVPACPA
jgi:hypothetical protein